MAGTRGFTAAAHFIGPEWEKAGRWLGSTAGAAPDKAIEGARDALAYMFSGRQAPQVDAAGKQLDTQPTFGAYANNQGRTFEKAFGAIPLVNMPTNIARQRMEDAIKDARTRSAEQVNQGPLPMSVDQGSVGTNILNLARTRSAAIKADASGRFEDLNSKVGADTLVDSAPVVRAIQGLMRDPKASADQIQGLQARLDYLNSMTYGQPYYNGPVFGHNIQPIGSIPLGQLMKFRSELGADLQSMPALDTVSQGAARDAITNVVAPYYQRRGLGDAWQQANDFYKMNIGPGTVTDKLDQIGGTPVTGKPGIYQGGVDEQAAYRLLSTNTQSPSTLEPFVDANSPYWRSAAGQFIDQLGQGKQGEDDFRGDKFGSQMHAISPEVLSQLTQTPSGGPAQPATEDLRAAEVLGNNSSVPVSRHGLTNAVGSLAAVEALSTYLGHHFADAGIPAAIGVPAAMGGLSYAMQTKSMTDAMAGRQTDNTPLVNSLYTGIPFAAASQNLNNPDDPRNQPIAPRPYSPLDQLNPPAQ